jgi:hypothetical protein
MCPFADWCEEEEEAVGDHGLRVLTGIPANLHIGRDATAQVVPTHYASEERIANLLERLGKPASADFIRQKIPEGPRIRSGDLGEILATEYVAEQTVYTVPIKRLRWKDHRNMAMRGDDVIAVRMPDEGPPLEFMKAESKSYAQLAAGVVTRAREALNKDGGLARCWIASNDTLTTRVSDRNRIGRRAIGRCRLGSWPITVLECDVIRPCRLPAIVALTARVEAAPLHHELGDARDGIGDLPRLLRRKPAVTERPFL